MFDLRQTSKSRRWRTNIQSHLSSTCEEGGNQGYMGVVSVQWERGVLCNFNCSVRVRVSLISGGLCVIMPRRAQNEASECNAVYYFTCAVEKIYFYTELPI